MPTDSIAPSPVPPARAPWTAPPATAHVVAPWSAPPVVIPDPVVLAEPVVVPDDPPLVTATRDPLLDLLRAVALVRVVLWHTFPSAALTWVAAMPVMFLVAGALLARSASDVRHRKLVARRARRLLVPLWAYGAFVAVVAGTVLVREGAAPPAPRDALVAAVTWMVPVVDPAGPDWLTSPLWYVRSYFWLVLLAPVVVRAARHLWWSCATAAAALVALEVAAHQQRLTGSARVVVGDLVAYGVFALLGAAWAARGRVRTPRSALAGAGLLAAAGAALWAVLVGVPGGVVSNSYPMTVLTGIATVCLVGLVEAPLRRAASRAPVAAACRAIGRRSLSVYLWHIAGVALAAAVVHGGGVTGAAGRAAVVLAVVAAAVATVGRLEDLGPGQGDAPTRGPARRVAGSVIPVLACCVLAVPVALSGAADPDVAARPPSWRAPLGDDAFAARAPAQVPAAARDASRALPVAELQATLDAWRERNGLRVASVAVVVDGRVWESTSGSTKGEPSMQPGEAYGVASVSKTFTATMVLEAVAAGLLDLDTPVPYLAGLPEREWRPTPRQLLQHTAGLVEPALTGRSRAVSLAAVRLALPPADWRPSAADVPAYTSVNYVYLGLVLEQVTGRPFEDLVADLARAHGLPSVAAAPGPGSAAGGITATATDLARFGAALLDERTVLPSSTVDEMANFDERNVGLGLWPACPCATDATGHKRATAIGHHVGAGGLYVWPGELALAVRMAPVGSSNEAVDRAVELGEALRAVLR